MAKLSPQGPFRAFDNDGNPLAGGKLYTFVAGTTTPKDTFTDESGAVANTNPVILDANGYADVWLGDGAYKFRLDDATDVTLWTIDDIAGDISESFGNTVVDLSTSTVINATYRNNVVRCTAAITLSLLDATSAGDGFIFSVRNDSAGDVTIDPDGSELIDGAATYTLGANSSVAIICNGTRWYTLYTFTLADGSVTFAKIDPNAIASQAEAEAGTASDKLMTPERTAEAIASLSSPFPARAAAYNSGNIVLTTGLSEFVANTELYDSESWYDTSNGRFTPLEAGKYKMSIQVQYSAMDSSSVALKARLRKNGVNSTPDFIGGSPVTGNNEENNSGYFEYIFDMNGTTDYLSVFLASSANTLTAQYALLTFERVD